MLVILASAAAVATGCGSDPDGAADDAGQNGGPQAGRACTEIGCDSGVFADLSGLREAIPEASKAEVCLGSSCEVFDRSQFSEASVVNRRLKAEGMRRVTMVVFDDSGTVISRSSVRTPSVRSQPNGEGCPPVCFSVAVGLDSDGRLVR
jgi:hypothetical protein